MGGHSTPVVVVVIKVLQKRERVGINLLELMGSGLGFGGRGLPLVGAGDHLVPLCPFWAWFFIWLLLWHFWHPKSHGRVLGVKQGSMWLPAKHCLQIPQPHKKQRPAPQLLRPSWSATPPYLSKPVKRSPLSPCWKNSSKNWVNCDPFSQVELWQID